MMATLETGKLLHDFLISKINKKGSITFAEFMEHTLYHPDWGYYNSPGTKIGKEGDFYTSAHVSHIFGQTVARQIIEMADYLGWTDLVILEFGGGEGYLARDILEAIKKDRPEEFKEITYYLCEKSTIHRESQKEKLKKFSSKIAWVNEVEEINNGQGFKGIVFSNELIDAFPVHRVKYSKGKLREVYVEYNNGFSEVIGELSNPQLNDYFSFLEFQLEEEQECEVNLEALNWLKSLQKNLIQGFIITIDYGYLINELKQPHRFAGTIMCYHKHQADDRPLENIGLKDITSHVNFTALIKYGEKFGFELTGYTNQMKFLVGLGIGNWLENPKTTDFEKQKLSLAMKELLMPERMGERFKVLIQHKGIKNTPSLSGLKGFE